MTRNAQILANAALALISLPLAAYILFLTIENSIPVCNQIVSGLALCAAGALGHFRGSPP